MKCKLQQNKDANKWLAQQPAVTQTQQQQDLHTTVGAGLSSSDTRSPEATKGRKQEVEKHSSGSYLCEADEQEAAATQMLSCFHLFC